MSQFSDDHYLGVLPSLEVLPLFADHLEEELPGWDSWFRIRSYGSYGEIARHLLTRKLTAGVVPWEIFVADVLSLPGQRNQWDVALFISACPTELVLRPAVDRIFYPPPAAGRVKFPTRLVLGVQNQNSLTKSQFQDWLDSWKGGQKIETIYKMLPVDLRIRALEAEAVDAIIVPSPWGMYAESIGIGKCDVRFTPGKFAQQVVLVWRKDAFENRDQVASQLPQMMAGSRRSLGQPSGMKKAVVRMANAGKPVLALELLERAVGFHGFDSLPPAIMPDAKFLTLALERLAEQSILPTQVAPSELTARLLVCDTGVSGKVPG